MGQKTNSAGLRLGINRNWPSTFFVNSKYLFFDLFLEDIQTRQYVESIFKSRTTLVNKIITKRTKTDLYIYLELYLLRIPKNIILDFEKIITNFEKTRKSKLHLCLNFLYDKTKEEKAELCTQIITLFNNGISNIPELDSSKKLFSSDTSFSVFMQSLSATRISANFISEYVAYEIENQQICATALKSGLLLAKKFEKLKGLKISCAGRLNGVQMARTDYVKDGIIPLNTLNAKIDFAKKNAYTIYGVIGIKVWLCYT